MTRALCVVGHTVPKRHRDGCTLDDCPGCLPAAATTGFAVCAWHEARTRDALRDLPDLWDDLADPYRGRRLSTGGRGDDGPPLLLSDAARAARDATRALLVSWCLVLHDDWAITYPADTVRAMAHHVAVQAGRLLASEHAEQLCADLLGHTDEDGGRHEGVLRYARRVAHPARRTGIRVPCPTCGERVPIEADAETIRCDCGEWGTQAWWRDRLAPNLDQPMAHDELRTWLLLHHRLDITRYQLRHWTNRGIITVHGYDTAGRARYDAVEVAAVAIDRRVRTA